MASCLQRDIQFFSSYSSISYSLARLVASLPCHWFYSNVWVLLVICSYLCLKIFICRAVCINSATAAYFWKFLRRVMRHAENLCSAWWYPPAFSGIVGKMGHCSNCLVSVHTRRLLYQNSHFREPYYIFILGLTSIIYLFYLFLPLLSLW